MPNLCRANKSETAGAWSWRPCSGFSLAALPASLSYAYSYGDSLMAPFPVRSFRLEVCAHQLLLPFYGGLGCKVLTFLRVVCAKSDVQK